MSLALVSASLSLLLLATGIHIIILWCFVSRFQVSSNTIAIYYMPYVLLHVDLCMLNYIMNYNVGEGLKMIGVHVLFDRYLFMDADLKLQLEVDTQKYRNFLPPLRHGIAWLGMCSVRK